MSTERPRYGAVVLTMGSRPDDLDHDIQLDITLSQ